MRPSPSTDGHNHGEYTYHYAGGFGHGAAIKRDLAYEYVLVPIIETQIDRWARQTESGERECERR
jgi:hypothetical protein